ncbi:beta-galactosidase [Elysia marginata]|uniref:Beta-galactosidase n=1 Tax=Elysia marginata TaxID=1093978 RepID=A0AAV4EJ15_9GAST|nr:beta-galactosidase [Elysia marginata]
MLRRYGVKEMMVTSDHVFNVARDNKKFDISKYALHTINSDSISLEHVDFVRYLNPHFPVMVMELWCGWFDNWRGQSHQTQDINTLDVILSFLMESKSSFNLYMFHGGTNFGFTSGAVNFTKYDLISTTYDYDAPLTEAGDTTPKYFFIREQLLKFYKTISIPHLPEVPPNLPKAKYGSLKVQEIMDWTSLLSVIPMQFQENKLDYMENYRDRLGFHYTVGYIIYSHVLRPGMTWARRPGPHLTGYVSGRLTGVLDGETFYVGTDEGPIQEDDFLWDQKIESMTDGMKREKKQRSLQLDLMVENQGRVNFFHAKSKIINKQRRGLKGQVLREVFGIKDEEWSIKFLHFDKHQCETISKSPAWKSMKNYRRLLEDTEQTQKAAPALYRTYLDIEGSPRDTFVKLDGWTKGIVIVNNFNLGRYWSIGPQKTLYLPAPLLKEGTNEIVVFEEMFPGESITLQNKPVLG